MEENGTTNVGTNSATYAASDLANGDIITCEMTSSDGCASPAKATSDGITMTMTPACTPPTVRITGANSICLGGLASQNSPPTTQLSPTTGGTWKSSNDAVATVTNDGVVTSVSAGTATFTFTNSAGCVSSPTPAVTVNPKPVVSITGANAICVAATTTLSPTTGGSWFSSDRAVATVDNAGVVTGVSGGTATFNFRSFVGCNSDRTSAVTVNALPTIGGPSTVKVGETITLTGGSGVTIVPVSISFTVVSAYASSDNAIATVSSSGVVTGVTVGTATITYTDGKGCKGTKEITVTPACTPPVLFNVLGGGDYCAGGAGVTIGLPNWQAGVRYELKKDGSSVSSMTPSGGSAFNFPPVTEAGTYTVVATKIEGGCTAEMTGSARVTDITPTKFDVTGGGAYCAGGTGVAVGLNGSQAGVSYQLKKGTENVGSAVLSPGTAGGNLRTVTEAGIYTVVATGAGCSATMNGSATVTVNPLPTLTGPSTVKVGETITLMGGSGTTIVPSSIAVVSAYASSDNAVATVSSSGVVTGVAVGTATITYTDANGCKGTKAITVTPACTPPTVSITGASTICIGSTTTLSPTTGGIWESSNTAVATVTDAGDVTGVSAGAARFTFTQTSTGCKSAPTNFVSVNPTPTAAATNKTQIICSGDAIRPMVCSPAGTGLVGGSSILSLRNAGTTVYNWTRDKTTEVAGMEEKGVANFSNKFTISGSFINTTDAPVIVTFTITPRFTSGGVSCDGTPITATVTVNISPKPTATSPQNFCILPTPTVAKLEATGSNIKWYADATGGSPLAATTALVNGNTYYASQTNETGCESSARVAVLVGLNTSCFKSNPGLSGAKDLPAGFMAVDPCTCNNNSDPTTQSNGTFNEFIQVFGPSGATITGNAVGGTPAMLTFTEVVGVGGQSTYTSNIFTHVDNIGYSADLFAQVGADAPVFIKTESNRCLYPNVTIDPKGPFLNCPNQADVPLTATITPTMTGTFTWSGTGVTGSNFNPLGLPIGNVTTNLSFKANFVNNVWDGITAANPGCIQTASRDIVIGADTEKPKITCPMDITKNTDAGVCGAIVTFTTPIGTDDCTIPITTQTAGLVSGATFPIGTVVNAFKVVDGANNQTTCSFTVTVKDTEKPKITCPPSQTLALGSFECSRVVVFADPSVSDNCSAPTFERTDAFKTSLKSGSSFTPGTYPLSYRATDAAGNFADCNFTIQVNGQLTSGRLTCIPTLTVALDERQCLNVIDAAGLLINNTYYCASSYSARISGRADNAFTNADIGKTFTITVGDNFNNTCSTVVTVVDTKAPVLNAPQDAVVTCADVSRDGRVLTNLTQPTIIYECGRTTFRTQDRAINLPAGQTSFNTRPDGFPADKNFDFTSAFNASRIIVRTYTATDESNNTSSVQQIVYVRSIDLSQVECPRDVTLSCTQSGFSTDIQSAGIPFVRGGRSLQEVSCGIDYLFSDERTDNAQGYVIRRTFTLINRSNNVRQTCTQTITVNCVNIPLLAISGSINKETGESVSATVKVFQSNSSMGDTQGSSYLFNQLVQGNAYRIQPERDNDVTNGVTTFDIALLSKHVLDIQPFTSPYQLIAADVNRDGQIDGSDMLLIRNLILRRITRFPSNTAWRFIPKSFVFADNKNPFADDFPEVLNYTNLSSNMDKADFVAIKVGDVNLNARAANVLSLATRTARPTENIYLTDKKMEAGKEYIFDVNIKNSTLKALQLALKIDKTQVTSFSVETGNLPQFETGNLEVDQKQGIVGMAWANTSKGTLLDQNSIIQLRITPRQSAWLHELVSLEEQNMENLAYDTEGGIEKQLQLKYNTVKTDNLEFELHQNRPNPFTTETTISFSLPETNNATLSIYDVNGREVYTLKQAFNKGYNEVKLDNTVLKNAGVYFYRLQSDKFTAMKRLQYFVN